MLDLKPLVIFNSQTIGKIFMPDGLLYEKNLSFVPSIMHGRSIAVRQSDYEWILIKGGGWNWGGPIVYRSKKDDELVFGLCPYSAAKRELEISKQIENISNCFPKVLYYKKLSNYKLPNEFDFLSKIRYSDGNLVDPCLLYTKVMCPFRVADIPYLNENVLKDAIEFCCKKWNISSSLYLRCFTENLARKVAILHKNNFINDTLEYSNVTLLAEIVDYELVTCPGISFSNGSDEQWKLEERREKEILYIAEIVLQLSRLLHENISFLECFKVIVSCYKEIYPEFIERTNSIKEIVNGEKFIL